MKYSLKEYLQLLDMSNKKIKYYFRLQHKNNNVKNMMKLHYNLFTFAMLIYAIKNRMVEEKIDYTKKILVFFEAYSKIKIKKTSIGKVYQLASEWRHSEGMNIRQGVDIKLGSKIEINVKPQLPETHPQYNKGEILLKTFEEAYKELNDFYKKLT